ncbi:MAG: hypothetical protein M0Z45_11145 [Actinomycetota bacterium]|nr:hypothetical protein [Actinomycetota bacterium]
MDGQKFGRSLNSKIDEITAKFKFEALALSLPPLALFTLNS